MIVTMLAALAVVAAVATPPIANASVTSWRRHHRHHHPHPGPSPSPSASPSASPSPSPSPSDGSTSPGGPPPQQVGVPYDRSRIPTNFAGRFPGYANEEIERTGELPITKSDNPSIDDTGAFRTVCKPSHMLPDDPIVLPGQPGASHLHTFFGNTGTDAKSTADSIAHGGNGSCRGGIINRTGYWVPTVIDTRTGQPIAPDLIHVYYKSGYLLRPDQIHPMPEGLRMVAGDSKASSGQPHGNWTCFDGGAGHDRTDQIHQCDANSPLSMNIEFPQCWNGKTLDSPDHKSHMAYPIEGKGCPDGYPVAIPVISFHVLYKVRGVDISGWRLSSDTYDAGKPGGYSVHGDWFYGWKTDVVNRWIPACVQRIATCGSHILGDGWVMKADDF